MQHEVQYGVFIPLGRCDVEGQSEFSQWSAGGGRCVELSSSVDSCCGSARAQFGNPEEGERSPLEAVTRGLVKTVTENTNACVTRTVKCSYALYKLITNPESRLQSLKWRRYFVKTWRKSSIWERHLTDFAFLKELKIRFKEYCNHSFVFICTCCLWT
jgi:hypothetical protein